MFIKKTRYEELRAKARQHDTLKIYTDKKIKDLTALNNKLLEENENYRDALRQISSSFKNEKQKQQYGSVANFSKKMTTKINEIVNKFKLS